MDADQETIRFARDLVRAGMAELPSWMRLWTAERFLLAIGWQESRWQYRVQRGGGPARGFFQFEQAGIEAVLRHEASRQFAFDRLRWYRYPTSPIAKAVEAAYEAMAHHDPLAVIFARLLIWTYSAPLPTDQDEAWRQYVALWRPGRPRRETWSQAWTFADTACGGRDGVLGADADGDATRRDRLVARDGGLG